MRKPLRVLVFIDRDVYNVSKAPGQRIVILSPRFPRLGPEGRRFESQPA
jgi:hypothetical protein